MATYNIDTTAPAYQNRLTGFRNFVQDIRPRLRAYWRAPPEIRAKIREHDPLIRDVLRFAEAVTNRDREVSID